MSALPAVFSIRIGRSRKCGEVSCTECTCQGNDFELIPTVKMETRHPVEGSFGSEFPAICNHCELWRPEVARHWFLKENFAFFGKLIPYGKIFRILFESFHRLIVSWNLADGKWVKSCVAHLPEKISPGYCADRIKTYQGKPPTMYSECSRFHPNRFTFGGVIAEREKTAKTCRKVNPILCWSLSSSRIILT